MTKITGRYEPKEGIHGKEMLDDILLHQEMLVMTCRMLIDFIKEINDTKIFSIMNHYDCHLAAKKLLKSMGEIDE